MVNCVAVCFVFGGVCVRFSWRCGVVLVWGFLCVLLWLVVVLFVFVFAVTVGFWGVGCDWILVLICFCYVLLVVLFWLFRGCCCVLDWFVSCWL